MKKALDYVSDYQLKSACKDAICIAPSKVTQMIFAVLEDWYHHIVHTHSFKLVSFFTYTYIHKKPAQDYLKTMNLSEYRSWNQPPAKSEWLVFGSVSTFP